MADTMPWASKRYLEMKEEKKQLRTAQEPKKQTCAFCGKEFIGFKPYHIDCFDDEIEKQFGPRSLNVLLLSKEHTLSHNPDYCRACSTGTINDKISALIKSGAKEGKRYGKRAHLFMMMLGAGMDFQTIRESILEFNSHCTPPEAEHIVNAHINWFVKRNRGF